MSLLWQYSTSDNIERGPDQWLFDKIIHFWLFSCGLHVYEICHFILASHEILLVIDDAHNNDIIDVET